MKIAYLHYSIYKTCPLQYKWRLVKRPDVFIPIDKRYTFVGLLIQKLVERFYLEKWWKGDPITRMRQALPIESQHLLDSDTFGLSQQELKEWLTVAHDTIPLIIKTVKEEKLLSPEVYVEREEEVLSFEPDVDLQGRADLIIVRDDIVTLLDGKGGKTIGRYVDNDQLYFYAFILKEVWLDRLPHRIGFWWYRHAEIRWLPVTNEAVDQLVSKVKQVTAGIRSQQFQPTPGQHCRLCDYRSICDEGQKFIASRHRDCGADIPEGNFGEVNFG